MSGKTRVSNTAENIALLMAIIMMGLGVVGFVMLITRTPVPFYRNAILPGWMANAIVHGWAIFMGVAGIWLYKITGAIFMARVTIEELIEKNRLLQQEAGVHKNVIEQ